MRRNGVFAVLMVLVLLLGLVVPPALSQSPDPEREPLGEEALVQDARMYVSRYGVDLEEAVRRLKLQSDIGDLNAKLTAEEASSFAGLWIQHEPEYRVIARFTHDGEVTIRSYVRDGPLADIVEVHPARVTLIELEIAREQAAQVASSLGVGHSSAISPRENRAELYVLDPNQFNAHLREADLYLPAEVTVLRVNELPTKVTDILGGKALSTCTSGLSVMNAGGTKGITTAGHCRNEQWYEGVQLPFQAGTPPDGIPSAPRDIQWHTAPGFTVRNLVWDGTYNRYIYGVRYYAGQSVGDWVCKYGMITGGGCGHIVQVGVDGVNVAADIPVLEGDSGGPWFWGNTAYGTTISRCTFTDGSLGAVYGPVDQIINILGLTILTN